MNQPLQAQSKGFFAALFDFSFKNYVTPKIIQVIFAIVVVVSAVVALLFVILAFKHNLALGIVTLLILAPLQFLVYVIIYRVLLEAVMALFAVAENTGQMARYLAGGTPGGFPAGTGASPVKGWSPIPAWAPAPTWAPTAAPDPGTAGPTPDPHQGPPPFPGEPGPPTTPGMPFGPPPSEPPPS